MIRLVPKVMSRIFSSIWMPYRLRAKNLHIGLGSICESVHFGSHNRIHKFVRLKSVRLDDFSYVANGARIQNTEIGKFCSIGPNCKIGLGRHPSRLFVSTHPCFYSTRLESSRTFVTSDLYVDYATIKIGNDVWIGESALIVDGVCVADGAIVGAGAVVTKNVPAYAVVVGAPAKVVRYRFETEDINMLLESKWWDRDAEWLARNAKYFSNIELFRNSLDRNEWK